MTTSSLPGMRPTSSTYGQDLENDKPIRRPTRELDATNWNTAKADLAFVGGVSPLAVLRINADATIAAAFGIDADYVTVTQYSTGQYSIVIDPASGVSITMPFAKVLGATDADLYHETLVFVSSTTVTFSIFNDGGFSFDPNPFVVVIW